MTRPSAALGLLALATGATEAHCQHSNAYPVNPAVPPYLSFSLLTNSSLSPFPVPTGISQVLVCGVGGGGGGGGVAAAIAEAAGGASGDFVCALYGVVSGGSVTYSIGAGGAGGNSSGGNGHDGTATVFGSLTFSGGPPGKGSTSGAGLSPNQSVINAARSPTAPSSALEIVDEVPPIPSGPADTSTAGAPSPWGAGAAAVTNGVGTPAGSTAYGAAGAGAASSTGSSGYIGGTGAQGAIVVRW